MKESEKTNPSKKKQCIATFMFRINLPNDPSIEFRCTKDQHSDGKHEHCAVDMQGWNYKVCWEEPQAATIRSDKPVFVGKMSKAIQ